MFGSVSIPPLTSGMACSILADDMGLGKTLQGVALLWTLLKSGNEHVGGSPVVKRVMIVCPTSLVNNWDGECKRWLQVRMMRMHVARLLATRIC